MKIGDKVKIVEKDSDNYGIIGVIARIYEDYPIVEMDGPEQYWDSTRHDFDMFIPKTYINCYDGKFWAYNSRDLEVISDCEEKILKDDNDETWPNLFPKIK